MYDDVNCNFHPKSNILETISKLQTQVLLDTLVVQTLLYGFVLF